MVFGIKVGGMLMDRSCFFYYFAIDIEDAGNYWNMSFGGYTTSLYCSNILLSEHLPNNYIVYQVLVSQLNEYFR